MKKKGFTLIETMIAISILILAILGPLTIAANALHSAYYATDQVTAFYLAQEGIEYIRYIRDNDYINSHETWDDGVEPCLAANPSSPNGCGLDGLSIFSLNDTILYTCSSLIDSSCVVRKDNDVYRQGLTSLPATNFSRIIKVVRVNDDEDQIISRVSWKTGNIAAPNNFQIVENIYNLNPSGGSFIGGSGNTLTVIISGTNAGGTVQSSPVGINNCNNTCSHDFNGQVTLTATPDNQSNFAQWSGVSCNEGQNSPSCTLNITADTTATAIFTCRVGPLCGS